MDKDDLAFQPIKRSESLKGTGLSVGDRHE